MCWSGEASAVLATIGLATTAYVAYRKEDPRLYAALGYFSLMELLQAYTYTVIDQCTLPGNQIATLLGYLHISFQPFFINMLSMYFIPDRIRKKIEAPVYILCFMSALFMIIQLYPMEWAGECIPGRALCGEILCSVSGNWHIAWDIPVNGIGNAFYNMGISFIQDGFPSYIIVAFLLPFLYGSWRMTIYHLMVGPMLAMALTSDVNERPAVWCLLSIGILLLVVKTPLRKLMFVNSWWFWPKDKSASVNKDVTEQE